MGTLLACATVIMALGIGFGYGWLFARFTGRKNHQERDVYGRFVSKRDLMTQQLRMELGRE